MKTKIGLNHVFIFVVFVFFPTASLYSSDKPCKENLHVIGDCFQIHGRLFVANGTPSVRIWRIGTKRILGVFYSEGEIMPDYIARYVGFDSKIYADFMVCPFTKERPGEMQGVCVESATNVVVQHFDEKGNVVKLFRLKNH